MNHFVTKLGKSLNEQLQIIDLEESDTIKKAQKSALCIRNSLTLLKEFTLQYTFQDQCEEIQFFKETKPELFSKLVYFVKIYKIESNRPNGSREAQEKYLHHELEKLTYFQNVHLDFYRYYRSKQTFLDDKFFVRGKEDISLYQNSLMFYLDPGFSTSHDYIVAKIIANDRLNIFLNTEIDTLQMKTSNPNWVQLGANNSTLFWTDSKASIVELIYALNAVGVFNNGNCEIRQLSALFEQAFNIHLADVYRTFLELKIRSNPTKFIDSLKNALLRKIEEDL